ncbi:hypothetical protein DV736_g3492, partial [Chaetothyriales sp. CBS 134916]
MDCLKDHFQRDQILDGRFKTIAPLNHGSFGMVFLAEDMVSRQEVAIKCLTKPVVTYSGSSPDDGVEELNCHNILKSHPSLVNLVCHFETETHNFLVLEYCSQGDLYEAIRLGKGPQSTDHVRRFMLQLINAVEHMHDRGLYHRDIKPENIFIAHNGSMKLGDFGLATNADWCYDACVGSDRYMAPEQYDPAGVGYSPAKADIWSIGICLLNVLFQRNPFVQPNEDDKLFADYRRDRQSIFDVFPSMSQDTFEILSVAMALDPSKRDLNALRQAVNRALSFTTDDEALDDFCTEDRNIVWASANREPLRTPSIQSPHLSGDSFPWTKALRTSPHRTLSAIPDTYEEDLFEFEKMPRFGESWVSGPGTTPSMASVFDSAYGSLRSVAIKSNTRRNPPRPDPVSIPNSLPIRSSHPIPTMSSIFGNKKDKVAKSWSEMFEEDEEESEREQAEMLARRELNSRTWSQDSQKDTPVPPGILTESKSHSSSNARRSHTPRPFHGKSSVLVDENTPVDRRVRTPRRPSAKTVPLDKWEALGDRRRNRNDPAARPWTPKKRAMTSVSRQRPTNATFDHWHRRDSRHHKQRPAYLDQDWRQQKVIDSSAESEDDHEWVGGWQRWDNLYL